MANCPYSENDIDIICFASQLLRTVFGSDQKLAKQAQKNKIIQNIRGSPDVLQGEKNGKPEWIVQVDEEWENNIVTPPCHI